jgi:hypothetical protein
MTEVERRALVTVKDAICFMKNLSRRLVAGRHVAIGALALWRFGSRRLIESSEVFSYRASHLLGLRPGRELTVDPATTTGISLDHTGIDRKPPRRPISLC